MTRDAAGAFTWPDGATVAVSLTFDVDAEAGFLGEGDEYRQRLTSLSEGHYGVRRGVPRILRLLAEYALPATFFVPGYTAETHRQLVPSLLASGHEIGHHGYLHLRSDKVSAELQRDEIERGFSALREAGADSVKGYRSTSWELTPETLDLLMTSDLLYDSSLMGDDRPYLIQRQDKTLIEIPVHWSLDDWPNFGWSIDNGGNVASTAGLLESWLAEYANARHEQRHVVFTMHPEVIGRGYRFAALEQFVRTLSADSGIWFARLDQVAAHVQSTLSEPVEVG